MLTLPQISRKKNQSYLAIKSSLTMRQIKKQGPLFLTEVSTFLTEKGFEGVGPAFFRYNQIDQDGQMQMEFGYLTSKSYAGDGPIRSGILPAGRFASVTWFGPTDRLSDVTAILIGWAKETGVVWDRQPTHAGDQFAGRLEVYHTNSKNEPDPDKWRTELAIKIKEPPVE